MADLRDPEQLPGVSRATGVDLAETMQDIYARAEVQLARRIAANLAAGIESPSWALDKMLAVGKLNDWSRTLLRRLGSDVSDEVRYAMVSAYLRGGTEATRALGELSDTLPEWITRAGVKPGERLQELLDGRRSKIADGLADLARAVPGIAALQRMIGSLALRITGTHLPVLRWVDDSYKRVIAETALTPVILGTAARRAGSQRAWEQLLTEGITGFTDRAGRGWNLASYVEMATRTGVAQAAVEGHLDRLTDAGIELVIVSNAPQECARCRKWEGKILARSGPDGSRTITVEHAITGKPIEIEIAGTVDEAIRAGLMHPNCRHSLSAYLPGVTRIPTNTEDPEGDEARQHLRKLERDVRKLKLKAAAVIDPAAQPALDAKVRAKQAEIREHVKATEHLGIMRKRERERLNLGNSAGLDAGKQAPKPKPTPKPTNAKPVAPDELVTITEVPTSESPAAKKYAAERAAREGRPPVDVSRINSPDLTAAQRERMSRDLLEGTYAGVDVRVTGVDHFDDQGDLYTTANGVLSRDGRKMGEVVRTFGDLHDEDGNLIKRIAVHELLEIDSMHRGQGFASEFNAHLEESYRLSGITEIHLTANIDVGGYAWARSGYDWADNLGPTKIVARIEKTLASLEADPSSYAGPNLDAAMAQARDYLRRLKQREFFGLDVYPTPYELSQIGRWPGAGRDDTWLGKMILLGSSWNGKKPI